MDNRTRNHASGCLQLLHLITPRQEEEGKFILAFLQKPGLPKEKAVRGWIAMRDLKPGSHGQKTPKTFCNIWMNMSGEGEESHEELLSTNMVLCWRRFFYHTGGSLKESGYAGELIAQPDASMDIPAIAPGTLHWEEVYAQKAKEQKMTETMSKLEATGHISNSHNSKLFFFMTRTHSMTGTVLLLFFLVLGALPASAQETRTFAKLGATLATITDESDGTGYRLGFGGGLSIERPFNRTSSGMLEVLYLGLGKNISTETTTLPVTKIEGKWSISYPDFVGLGAI